LTGRAFPETPCGASVKASIDCGCGRAVSMKINPKSAENLTRYSWWRALLITMGLRLTYTVFTTVAGWIQSPNWERIHSNALTENLPPPSHTLHYLLLGVWERFDTLWYLRIAAHGYDRPDAVVFFPLYPSLVKVVSLLLPPMGAALLISTLASFFLFWGLQELLIGDEEQSLVDHCVLFSAVWPGSFIFFAGYPESLLLALIVWSLAMARKGRWPAAVALAIFAALTKAVGTVVVVPLLIVAIRQRRRMMALPVLLVPFGSIGFLAYLHWTGYVAPALAYARYWRTSMASPWRTLWESVHTLASAPNPILMLNLIFLISVCVLVLLSRLRAEYLLYSAAVVVVLLCKETTPPLQSMMRYLLIIFPAYAGLAHLLRRGYLPAQFAMVCAALMVVNLGLLWLFSGWSLVL
jgi:hypothetical protein